MPTKVKFLKDYQKNKSGDVVDMDISDADPLEENGVVEFVKPEAPKEAEHKTEHKIKR